MKRTPTLAALALCSLAAVMLLVPAPSAQADVAKVRGCLDQMVAGAVAGGMRLRSSDVHAAGAQEAVTYRITLYKGMSYVLLGCADGAGVDLDMRLYDAEGNLVSEDKADDERPFVDVSPDKTGEYALQVLVYKSSAPKTDFAVAVAYQF